MTKGLLLLLLSCLILFVAQAKTSVYDGYKVYELQGSERSFDVSQLLKQLSLNESYYEQYASNVVLVHPQAQQELQQLLAKHKRSYKLLCENVGESLERQYKQLHLLRHQYPFEEKLSTERYYSHAEINLYIEQLAEKYPQRVYVKKVGKSYEGRWLKTITITNGDGRANKNVILVDGGFHAREWISPATAVYIIGQLVEQFDTHAALLLDYDWVILPVVNADGYEYTQSSQDARMWRKTRQPSSELCIGTDPNRNFGYHWNETGASADPCSNTYAGPKAFSEPEAMVVRDLIHTYGISKRGKMYLTLHSHGQYLLYPWGYIEELPATWPDLDEVARAGADAIEAATGTVYQVGCSTTLLYPAAGASDDYAFNGGFPITYTMELPAGGDNLFDPPAEDIDRLVKESWLGIEAMARRMIVKYPLIKD